SARSAVHYAAGRGGPSWGWSAWAVWRRPGRGPCSTTWGWPCSPTSARMALVPPASGRSVYGVARGPPTGRRSARSPHHPVSAQPVPAPLRTYELVPGLLSLLVPGLGQIHQGRVGKGLLFLVCIYTLFFYGLALGHWKNVYLPRAKNLPDSPLKLGGKTL